MRPTVIAIITPTPASHVELVVTVCKTGLPASRSASRNSVICTWFPPRCRPSRDHRRAGLRGSRADLRERGHGGEDRGAEHHAVTPQASRAGCPTAPARCRHQRDDAAATKPVDGRRVTRALEAVRTDALLGSGADAMRCGATASATASTVPMRHRFNMTSPPSQTTTMTERDRAHGADRNLGRQQRAEQRERHEHDDEQRLDDRFEHLRQRRERRLAARDEVEEAPARASAPRSRRAGCRPRCRGCPGSPPTP